MPITRRRRANPPDQPENNNHLADPTGSVAESLTTEAATDLPPEGERELAGQGQGPLPAPGIPFSERVERVDRGDDISFASLPTANGDRLERQEYIPPIESGRRTPRGELFRRPPQVPPLVPPPVNATSLPTPTHEITLPLGDNLLHLAYNPGYTGADEVRSRLLHQLSNESKAGGRARCWNCSSLAIAYECWNTRSKTFGEVGVAICEICGVWSVM